MGKENAQKGGISMARRMGSVALKCVLTLLAVVIILATALFALMWVLARGPSPTAQRLFVLSVKETSAIGFLANIYLSDGEIEIILADSETEDAGHELDTSLINVPSAMPPPIPSGNTNTASTGDDGIEQNLQKPDDNSDSFDEDGDGIEIHDVFGAGYRGIMMIVHDPKRVYVGAPSTFGGVGFLLSNMVERSGAVAGINGGGFYDPDGKGTGGIPDGIVICDGVLRWGAGEGRTNVIGFDADGILHVGTMTPQAAMDLGIQWAVTFGPTLISNGVAVDVGNSGINPRTAIGQRADGAVLMLVVDGRQISSLGARWSDLIEIFMDFGAVNAANLDGGSSTQMIYGGETINKHASVVGPRYLPTAFLVAPLEGDDENE